MNHLSFSKLKLLAIQGNLPKQLATTEPPFCLTWTSRKSRRKPWR